ncbi:DUF1837 domain-containing protein [Curtobacterium flaccumfaciens]|uniref:HamA C-terminal domain-containing protein n=1 Tax=Curtobacterium flaccumfaciens TaxID=2035 RepID=UPI00265A79F9|nr:DUF1837 domain-containing protein [Curtobacterium flaccumfaciens]MCS5504255.1 DUF1837 domain-containing protein [Curtobacterium flaccumfaciens pv. flaccumfaciens]
MPLVEDTFDRHLLSFALAYSDLAAVSGSTALTSIRDAARSVYASDKYKKRGEFGELLMHGALVDFFGAETAVSKIFYKDSANDTVKGFDGVHLVDGPDGVELWFGEAKFYSDAASAIDSAVHSLKEHLDADFLRQEFMLIARKVDSDWPRAQEFKSLLARTRSLDDIVAQIVMPIFVTYDSLAVNSNAKITDAYKAQLVSEAQVVLDRLEAKLDKPLLIDVRLILVPLASKDAFVRLLHKKLKHLQGV